MVEILTSLTGVIAVGAAIWIINQFLIGRSEAELDEISRRYFKEVVLAVKEDDNIEALKEV